MSDKTSDLEDDKGQSTQDDADNKHSANNNKRYNYSNHHESSMDIGEETGARQNLVLSPRKVDVIYYSQNDRFRDGLSSSRRTPRNVNPFSEGGGGSPHSNRSVESYSVLGNQQSLDAPRTHWTTNPEFERSNSMAQHICLEDTDNDEELVDSSRKSQHSRREPTPKLSAMMQKFESQGHPEFADPNDFYDM